MVINSPCLTDKKELAIPGQTTTGKEFSNPLMADSLPKTILPTKIATVETVNNGEQQLTVTVDGQIIAIAEAFVRRHLQLVDANGISSLPNTKIFKQLTLMGTKNKKNGIKIPIRCPSSVAYDSIIKEMHNGLVRATTTASSIEAEQGSGNIAKTQTKATSSGLSSPRSKLAQNWRSRHKSRSGEGSMQLLELITLCTKLSNKVTSLEDELASTKAVYNKALITLTKRVKKLEKQLKHKRRRIVIDSSKDEGLSLDAKDSPKQGRMIEEINNDDTVNLVKSRELGKSHDTAEHRMESEHDDDDRTLAETLLNIKKSAAKGKAIMQESKPPKKIKKKDMIQISLDEEFAKSFYEEEQAQILQDKVYAKQVEAQWIADEERIPQEAK
ncbi:hypothetical protein Tco_0247926 [Tanacetum coccineum]